MKTDEIITRTDALYSGPLPEKTMTFLRGIAQDYCKIKIMCMVGISVSGSEGIYGDEELFQAVLMILNIATQI